MNLGAGFWSRELHSETEAESWVWEGAGGGSLQRRQPHAVGRKGSETLAQGTFQKGIFKCCQASQQTRRRLLSGEGLLFLFR